MKAVEQPGAATGHAHASASRFADALFGPDAHRPDLWLLEGNEFTRRSWDQRQREAARVVTGLRALGIERGDRVCCLLTNSHPAAAGLLGGWLAGATMVSLPTLSRGMRIPDYLAQLEALCRRSGTDVLLLEERFVEALGGAMPAGLRVTSFESLLTAAPATEPSPPVDDDVVFVQFSSGSTSDPTGCMLSGRAIVDHIERLCDALAIGPHDFSVGWIPLSHDMSLFGGLLNSWIRGPHLALGTPERFLTSPRSWLRDMSHFGATLTAGPNFGLAMLLARGAHGGGEIEPFPLRATLLGSDRIEWRTLERTVAQFGALGMKAEALTPAYGLAEATLAVSTMTPGVAPHRVTCDPERLAAGELERVDDGAPGVSLVSCGKPLRDTKVEIDGRSAVGEILVRSPSLADGYLGDPERTREKFAGGTLRTGDLGFVVDGELFVTGRIDDLMIVGGRNVYAHDIEVELNEHDAVRSGACAVLDVHDDGGRRLVLMAELVDEATPPDRLAASLQRTATGAAGVSMDQFVFLRKGTIPKTPSGKIQRYRCRQLLAGENPGVIAVVG